MPSSYYYNGRQTFTPGVYTVVNTSNFNTVNAQASGIVAIIGQAAGGTPYTAVKVRADYPSFTSPTQLQQYFGSGDLVEAANICFAPSNDPAILGGAQTIIALNVVPSTQATVTLASNAAAALTLSSKTYGVLGNTLNASVSAGSVSGTMLMLNQGSITETFDNLGTGNFGLLKSTIAGTTAAFDSSGNLTVAQAGTSLFTISASQTVGQLQAAAAAVAGGTLSVTYTDSTKSSLLMSQLDHPSGSQNLQTGLNLSANLTSIANYVNNNSQLAIAVALASGTGAPSVTTSPQYLAGGSTSAPTLTDYQNCFNLLEQIRVNSVVALSSNPAINAMADAHCVYMCGAGQSERDAFVGLQNSSQTGNATLAQIQAQTQAINSRHTRCVAQTIATYNSAGVLTTFAPHFLAAAAAGMQAGAGVGVPLTHKTISVVGAYQDASWSPTLNSDQLLQSGLLFFQQADNIGVRCVRNITSYQTDNNIAYCEGSVNQALDYATYNLRYALQQFVGAVNFSGTLNSIQAAATAILQQMQATNIIVGFQTPVVTQNGDQAIVAVALSPVSPVNFIPCLISVVQPALLAA